MGGYSFRALGGLIQRCTLCVQTRSTPTCSISPMGSASTSTRCRCSSPSSAFPSSCSEPISWLFWGWTALGTWLLSLGPILHVWGERVFWGLRIPLPYAALLVLPPFSIFRVPSRLMVLVMLALAVLAGY